MNLNVKTGDTVVVLAGKDKGKTGKVIKAFPAKGRVTVEDVNVVTKHKKPKSAQVPGGIKKEPGTIDVSNVQIICPSCSKATRVANKEVEGKKHRVCHKCGASLDVKVKADKKDAKKKPAKSAEKEDKAKKTEVKDGESAPAEKKAPAKKAPAKKPAAKKTEAVEANNTAPAPEAEKAE